MPTEDNGQQAGLFIGLISGTSIDAVDAALLEIADGKFRLVAARAEPWPDDLRRRIATACADPGVGLDELGMLDCLAGRVFARAAATLMAENGLSAADVTAIGSHGQTVRHRPDLDPPFTLQIGDPNQIARITGVPTVADFRRMDMALGGQGAPLVPAFHAAAFAAPGEPRVVLNLGGIANITVLSPAGEVFGFDTGPGNVLLDHWFRRCHSGRFDRDGALAAAGNVDESLLASLLADPYFRARPPKSTGPEYFNLAWLEDRSAGRRPGDADMQATLSELTARSVAAAVADYGERAELLLVCGGGARNANLMSRLARLLPGTQVSTTALLDIDPDYVEAAAFAWLAARRLDGAPGNAPAATGAARAAVLGGSYAGG